MKQQTFFGVKGIQNATPIWAKWVFLITAIVTTVLAFWVAATGLIEENWKVEIMLGLKSLDMLVLGLSKATGVAPADPPETE